MRIQTPRSLVFGSFICLALLAAGCADHAPPLEPSPTGALLAGQGQGPQNPEVVVLDLDVEDEIPGFCDGYGDFPAGFTVGLHIEGQVRVTLRRHPISGAVHEVHLYQGVNVTATGNDRVVSATSAGPRIFHDPTQIERIGLHAAFTAPGWGVILLDAGRIIFDLVTREVIWEAGPHQDYYGDFDKLCRYFTS
jgi:hypothetical protein